MKHITTHHDGHGLNESIVVRAVDNVGPGGAHHEYEFIMDVGEGNGNAFREVLVGSIRFQKGPRNVEGSIPGVTTAAILAMLIDHLTDFQAGPYACEENAEALAHLEQALAWTRDRANKRAERGVLGTYAK